MLLKDTTTLAEKNKEWCKSKIDEYIEMGWLSNTRVGYDLDMLYRAVQGELNVEDYAYVLNPYNTENKKLQRKPAKLRNYNIILPMVDLFLGERNNKPNHIQVGVSNVDLENLRKDKEFAALQEVFAQRFVNALNSSGVQTNVPSKAVPPLEEIKQQHLNYNDERAVVGQEALNYLRNNLKIDHKLQKLFFHFIVCGQCFTYKGVFYDDVDYKVIDPRDLRIVGLDENSELIEDADAVICRERLTPAQVVDKYRNILSEESILRIEALNNSQIGWAVSRMQTEQDIDGTSHTYSELDTTKKIDCFHVQFRTFRKIGILSYTGVDGQITTMEVADDYVLDKANGDIDIEWEWRNEFWEGYRFDENIYASENGFENGARPCLVQRQMLNNKSKCKGNYNGIFYPFPSIVKRGMEYQALYNIFQFRFELTMARNKDKFVLFPMGLIPKKQGWDEDKFIYFAENTQFGFYDESAPNASVALQGIKVVDLSLGQYAASMKDILAAVKQEYWDSIGMNRQRAGDVMASDGKGVNQDAAIRSAITSDECFRYFRYFVQSDYQGLLDTSKLAWIDGRKLAYMTSDGRQVFLDIDGESHLEADYDVFALDSEKEEKITNSLKALAQPLLQNGGTAPIVAEIVSTDNSSKVRGLLRKAWQAQEDLRLQSEQADRDSNEKIAANGIEAQRVITEREKYKVDKASETAVKVAYLNNIGKTAAGFNSEEVDTEALINELLGGFDNLSEQANMMNDKVQSGKDADAANSLANRKIDAGILKQESAERIAKMNKN